MAVTSLTIYNDALRQIGARRLSTVTDDAEEQRAITDIYDDTRDELLKENAWTFAQKRAELIDMTMPDVDDWENGEAYAVGDDVVYGDVHYNCLVANTAGIFTDDLASLYWELLLDWVTATQYEVGDKVYNASGLNYTCLVAHKSTVFATDLVSIYWIASEELAMTSDGMTIVYYRPTDYIETTLISNIGAKFKIEGQRILSNTSGLKIVYTYKNDTPSEYTAMFRRAFATKLASEICFSLTDNATKAEALMEKYLKIVLPKALSDDSQQGTPKEARADEWELSRLGGVGSGISGQTNDATWHPIS